MSDNTTDELPDSITVEFPLDEVHAPIVANLRAAGVDIDDIIVTNDLPNIEQTLYQAHRDGKYAHRGD